MSVPVANPMMMQAAAAAAAADDVVTKSLRFNASDSPHLSRTFGTGTSTTVFTYSLWLKLGNRENSDAPNVGMYVLDSVPDTGDEADFKITGSLITGGADHIQLGHWDSSAGAFSWYVRTNALFRDYSNWYHFTICVDTGESGADTVKIWQNGNLLSHATASYPSGNHYWNEAVVHNFGRWEGGTSRYYDGYLADAYFIDGTALTPTSFAEEDATTGQWKPKAYDTADGAYGNNGFHLEMKQTGTGTGSSSTIGADTSGEDNHFDTGGLAASDLMLDNPSPGKNYCVLNPLQNTSSTTLSEGNLKSTWVSGSGFNEPATIGATSGKYYFEVYKPDVSPDTANQLVGITRADTANTATMGAASANTVAYMANASGTDSTGFLEYNGSSTAFGSRWDDAAYIIQCAFDADTGKVWFGRDNTWQDDTSGNTPDVAAGTYPAVTLSGDEALMPAIRAYGAYMVFNGGQDPTFAGNKSGGATSEFFYTPPSGYSSLSTGNLPTPTIAKGEEHFDTKIWTGDGSSSDLDITGLSFEPDLIWYKSRTDATHHCVQDDVRGWGATKIGTNSTATEDSSNLETQYGYIKASVSGSGTANGFTVAQGASGTQDMVHTNMSEKDYVAWNWKKSATAGFNIVGWTGDDDGFSGGTQAVAHGLGVAPEMVIAKNRTDEAAGNGNWIVYHKDTTSGDLLKLNSTDGEFTPDMTLIGSIGSTNVSFGNDSPNSEYLNSDNSFGSGTPDTYIGYFFASVAGFSKVGSFSGSSTALIYTDFRPSFILAKRSDATGGNWLMFDDKREGYNVDNDDLMANSSAVEATTDHIDILSNGFKVRTSDADLNGGTLIYLAVAKNPFKYASAR